MTTDEEWFRLADLHHSSNLVKVDDEHFMVLSEEGIFSYSTKTNEWKKLREGLLDGGMIAFDSNSKRLCIPGNEVMSFFNIKTRQLHNYKMDGLWWPYPIQIRSELHFLTGFQTNNKNEHWIWDDNAKDARFVDKIHEIPKGRTFSDCEMIYIPRTNMLLLFGGQLFEGQLYDEDEFRVKLSNKIRSYSVSTGKWELLNITLPNKIKNFACVLTKEQRYILIIGGKYYHEFHDKWFGSQSILIFDVMRNEIVESNKKLPQWKYMEGHGFNAIMMEDKMRNDLLVHGFVKDNMKKYDLNIPFALIKVIEARHSIEYVHVMVIYDDDSDEMRHWKINVDRIFDN